MILPFSPHVKLEGPEVSISNLIRVGGRGGEKTIETVCSSEGFSREKEEFGL